MTAFPARFSIRRTLVPSSTPDAVEELLKPAEWILEAVSREVGHLGIVQIEINSYRDAVGILFSKAASTFMAIIVLTRAGHDFEAAQLARSLLNLDIDLAYMTRIGDREENAQRFMDYGWMDLYKMLKRAREVYSKKPSDIETLKAYESHAELITSCYEEVRPKFEQEKNRGGKKRRPHHWARHETIAERAEALGSPYFEHYQIGYAELSAHEHPGSAGALHHKRFPERIQPVEYVAGPARARSNMALVVGCECFLDAFSIFGATFGINAGPIVKTGKKLVEEADEKRNAETGGRFGKKRSRQERTPSARPPGKERR